MCGIFGVIGNDNAVELTKLGLHALQHRGQESAGIASSDGETVYVERALGLVGEVFAIHKDIHLPGSHAIGHVRYSTAGSGHLSNAQPIVAESKYGQVAVVHNGNLPYSGILRTSLVEDGDVFESSSDTAVVLHQIGRSNQPTLLEAIIETVQRPELHGAYSMLFLTKDSMIAIRDPRG